MVDRAARTVALKVLDRARGGTIDVVENGRTTRVGTPDGEEPLRAVLEVRDRAFWPGLARGSSGLATAYADGLWTSPDVVELIRVGARNGAQLDAVRRALRPVLGTLRALGDRAGNTITASRKQIAAHYDLGNELFSRFLDETLTYSCAIFPSRRASLREAQVHKLDVACRKLGLGPGDHVLEIGTGWGGFALHAAGRYGARVTTTTISREQHRVAVRRVREAGLGERVRVLADDYRQLRGAYDKLVSIEMIEAVGWRNLGAFFRACSDRLRSHGAMLLQAITIDDAAYDVEKGSRTFIREQIFPGGDLPSLAVIHRELARHTDLRATSLEDITPHYPETLRRWRASFLEHAEELAAIGYDTRFRRLWELYLAYSEAGFRERRIRDVQLVLAKPLWEPATGWMHSEPAASAPGGT